MLFDFALVGAKIKGSQVIGASGEFGYKAVVEPHLGQLFQHAPRKIACVPYIPLRRPNFIGDCLN